MIKNMYLFFRRYKIIWLHWEYWHSWVIYFLSGIYFVLCAIRLRSFFFYSASNPTIETGGKFFESKYSLYKLIPQKYQPNTILINENTLWEKVLKIIEENKVGFPIMVKPDRGETGWLVQKILNVEELREYHLKTKIDFLIQEYIDYPIELGIFYYRYPNKKTGTISSIVIKQHLTIQGNGIDTLEELIIQNPRAFLQYETLKKKFAPIWHTIIEKNNTIILSHLGNHIRGALFLNGNKNITPQLIKTIDEISKEINGFYFGRFDIKCNSLEELTHKKNFKIIELNGAGSIPAHIFDPNYSFIKAQQDLLFHIYLLYKISKINHTSGITYMSFKTYIDYIKRQKKYKSTANQLWNI